MIVRRESVVTEERFRYIVEREREKITRKDFFEIIFRNGIFKEAKYNLLSPYTLEGWELLSIINKEINAIVEEKKMSQKNKIKLVKGAMN